MTRQMMVGEAAHQAPRRCRRRVGRLGWLSGMGAMVSLPVTWVQRSCPIRARGGAGFEAIQGDEGGGALDAGRDGEGGAGDMKEGAGGVEAVGDAQAHAVAACVGLVLTLFRSWRRRW